MNKKYAPFEVGRLIRKIAAQGNLKHWQVRHYSTAIELTDDDGVVCDWVMCEGRNDVYEIRDAREAWMREVGL